MVADQPVDAEQPKLVSALEAVDRPADDSRGPSAQSRHHSFVEKPLVNRHPVKERGHGVAKKRAKLTPRAHRLEEPHVLAARERIQQRAAPRANRDGATFGQGIEDELGEARVATLEIQQELRAVARLGKDMAQFEPRRERVGEPPPVPQDRQRACRLQVPHLEASSPEPHVDLDEIHTEFLGLAQAYEVVSRAVGDDERHPARASGESSGAASRPRGRTGRR